LPSQTFFNLEPNKRQQIVDASIQLFATIPYKKVSIDKIVAHANIPKGSFYQYFTNKDDLYKYLFMRISDEKKQYLYDAFETLKQLSFSECMRHLYHSGMSYDKKKHEDLKDNFLLNCKKELHDEIVAIMSKESIALFEAILNDYKRKGEIKKEINVKLTAQILTTLSLYMGKTLEESQSSDDQVVKTIDEMMLVIESGIL